MEVDNDNKSLSPSEAEECTLPTISDCDTTTNTEGEKRLSKRQLRRQEKKAKWEKLKPLKRQKERLKKKEQKQKRKLNGEDELSRKTLKANTMKESSCQVGVAIDMSFDHLMNNKDLCKCVKQIHRCYSINRRLKEPLQMYVTNFTGESTEIIAKHDGWNNWDVNFTQKTHMEIDDFPKDSVIYLTSESDNTLQKLENGKLYVIGGIVDHNSKKGLCHSLAMENKIGHARLPITEFMSMKTRKVLSIDHVFEILSLVTEGLTWEQSLVKVLPQRKAAVPRKTQGKDDSASSDDEPANS